jgi:hypothetical protein
MSYACYRCIRILRGVFREQFMGKEHAIRTTRDNVSKRTAAINEELPLVCGHGELQLVADVRGFLYFLATHLALIDVDLCFIWHYGY